MYKIILLAILTLQILTACTWETYQTDMGKIKVRQKYQNGVIYYTNGAASHNMYYHDYRPEPHVLSSDSLSH